MSKIVKIIKISEAKPIKAAKDTIYQIEGFDPQKAIVKRKDGSLEITVDDQEFDSCLCFPRESKPSLWLAISKNGRVKYTTDSSRVQAWKDSGSYRLVRSYYTAPPKCEWVGLTDEEIFTIEDDVFEGGSLLDLCRSVEAKLKEKNT